MAKATVVRKIASTLVCLQLVSGTMPVHVFAAQDKDHLRPKALMDGGTGSDVVKELTRDSVKGDFLADGGAATAAIPYVKDYGRQELAGLRVLLSLDLNMSDDSGNIKSLKRLEEALPTILYYLDMGATPVIVSHNGRPGGKVVDALKMGPIAEKMQEMIAAAGRDYKVKFHPDSITEKGLKAGLNAEIEEGSANLIDNSRFFAGEESDYTSFCKEMAAVVDFDHFGSDAFGAYERVHASRAGAARYIQTIAEGPLMKKEYRYLLEALDVLEGLVIGGGPKLQEKLDVVKNVARTMKSGSFIAWGSAPMASFLKVLYDIDAGVDPSTLSGDKLASREENLANARETIGIAREKNIDMVYAVDFVACDKDPAAKAEVINSKGKPEMKNWIDQKKAPEGAKLMNLRLVVDVAPADGRAGKGRLVDKATGEAVDATKVFLVDIGDDSRAVFAQKIKGAGKGKAVFHNGPVGICEIPLFAAGGKAVDEAMAVATRENGVITVIGGADTVKEAEKNKVDRLVTHCSTGGGASAALLKGETLKVAKALTKLQETIAKNLSSFSSDMKGYLRFLSANKQVFSMTGGQSFRRFVNAVKSTPSGFLSDGALTSEVIKDSRGKPTVRAVLTIGDVTTVGEVPAGASKGADEARAIDAQEAAGFVPEIEAMLKKSNLNLAKYDDLKQALAMVRNAAGAKYEKIPANAIVPVSYALWRMSAKLNDMELWEYIRWNEPGLVGKGTVAYYLNIFNGGLHAIKDGENLGVDRIDFQEIMSVIDGLGESEKLALADTIDRELEKLLKDEVRTMGIGEASITRADEAGFSVKGLGSSDRAIELVRQAIRNAGPTKGSVQLALDVAATSFAVKNADGTYTYHFQGKDMTTAEMIQYYVALAEKYNTGGEQFIRSLEDPLAEDDWDGFVALTAEMNKRGILVIGDDLFVTQMERLKQGVELKAATAILIKVNQNGILAKLGENGDGTLDVIQYARDNGLEIVVSHRSGETLDAGIADLAYAVKAMGIKTGDSQRTDAFPDSNSWVRRNKYLRLGEIEKNAVVNGGALLVSPGFFNTPGAVTALNVAAQADAKLKIAVYGDDAQKLKALLPGADVIAAAGVREAVEALGAIGIAPARIVQVRNAADGSDDDAVLRQSGVKQLVSGQAATITVAKAVKEAAGTAEADAAFASFYKSLADEGIVTGQVYEQTSPVMLAKLDAQMLELPSMELSLDDTMKEQFSKAKTVTEEFISKV